MPGLTRGRVTRRPGALLLVACALCVPLVAGVVLAFMQTRASFHAEEAERLGDAARSIAVAVDARLGTYVASLEALAASPALNAPIDVGAFTPQARIAGAVLGGTVVLRGPLPEAEVLLNTAPEQAQVTGLVRAGAFPQVMQNAMAEVYETRRPALSDLFETPLRPYPLLLVAIPVEREGHPVLRLSLSKRPIDFQVLLEQVGVPAHARADIRDGALTLVATSAAADGNTRAPAPPWLQAAAAGRDSAVLSGEDLDGRTILVAMQRLALAPRWIVTVAAPQRSLDAVALGSLAWPTAGVGLVTLGIASVAWAARQERDRRAREDAAARAEVDRLHGNLPAVIFLREVASDGTFGRLLYRTGDVVGVTGWTPEELGETFLGSFAEDPEDVRHAQARFVRDGEVTHDWRMRQRDGGWRWIRTKVIRLETLADGSFLTLGYLLDVTAEREARAQAEAASRLASMAELAHGLAHELRQPLQVIALQAEGAKLRLKELALGEAAARIDAALDGIAYQAVRTGDLVEHLRRFARGAAATDPPEPVALDRVVDAALELTRHTLSRSGVVLEIALGQPPLRVLGQPIAIEQILLNLLHNARDALAELAPDKPRQVRIAATRLGDGSVALTVSDTGGGVPEHIIDRIFEPFVTTKRVESGTGLGLAICHGLARGMGGKISVRNGAQGAEFTLQLPAAAPP